MAPHACSEGVRITVAAVLVPHGQLLDVEALPILFKEFQVAGYKNQAACLPGAQRPTSSSIVLHF